MLIFIWNRNKKLTTGGIATYPYKRKDKVTSVAVFAKGTKWATLVGTVNEATHTIADIYVEPSYEGILIV